MVYCDKCIVIMTWCIVMVYCDKAWCIVAWCIVIRGVVYCDTWCIVIRRGVL